MRNGTGKTKPPETWSRARTCTHSHTNTHTNVYVLLVSSGGVRGSRAGLAQRPHAPLNYWGPATAMHPTAPRRARLGRGSDCDDGRAEPREFWPSCQAKAWGIVHHAWLNAPRAQPCEFDRPRWATGPKIATCATTYCWAAGGLQSPFWCASIKGEARAS